MKRVSFDIQDRIENGVEQTRKKGQLSLKAIRQLKTLEHYFKIDYVNRIVTIPIHYEKASDVIDFNFSNKDHPYIKKEFLSSISDMLHSIPIEFLINVDVKIDDYEGYKPEIIIKSMKDSFEIFHYDVIKERTKSNLKVAMLIFIGVTILAWLFYLCSKKIIGPSGDPTHDTIHELIYTIGAVVLWEAVYIIFLPSDEYNNVSYYLLWRMNILRVLDKNNKVLHSISTLDMSNSWMIETKKERRARYFLLIAGTTLVCLSAIKIRDIVELFFINPNDKWNYVLAPIGALIVIFGVLAGIGAISFYRDKGPFKKFTLSFGVIASIFYIVETILIICIFIINKTYQLKPILSAIAYVIVMILYTSCAFLLRNKKKERQKNK